jgi:FAD/FMN-containing dehydrogenase
MAASRGSRRPLAFVEDTAVPPERLNDYVADFKAILDARRSTRRWPSSCSPTAA